MQKKAPFIVFEGLDGSGKSTQAKLLCNHIEKMGKKVLLTCEPTDGKIGKLIREILSGSVKSDPRVIALLFASDRLNHVTCDNGINAARENGTIVVSDRFYFSSYAYQALDMPFEFVAGINSMSKLSCKPDVHIFIDLPVSECMKRINANRDSKEIFETNDKLQKTYDNFQHILKTQTDENIVVIDGNRSTDEVFSDVLDAVKKYL